MSPASSDLERIFLRAFPAARLVSAPEPIEGGNLNEVWRLRGSNGTCILKHAPDHIAALPHLPLDPHRIHIEAYMLALLDEGGMLGDIVKPRVRVPHCYYFDADEHILLMEDVAPCVSLDRIDWGADAESVPSAQLGQFVGELHRRTLDNDMLRARINNPGIQEVRLEIQYKAVAAMLVSAGAADGEEPGQRALALGEKYLSPGKCAIMGDLWPRSILVDAGRGGIRVIDWELAHFGRPAQDIGHLAAHYWMMAHRAADEISRNAMGRSWATFFRAYRRALGEERRLLWDTQERRDACVHFGCEILARTIGSFRANYLYENCTPNSRIVRQAVRAAVQAIRESESFGNMSGP